MNPGERGFLSPVVVDGKPLVMLPEMLVGLLLEMVCGSELTPKGGLGSLLEAHESRERGDAVVEEYEKTGLYGRGAYKNEPWSCVAVRKRVTTVRKFYEGHLQGIKEEVNPGWHPMVKSTMVSITLLLGTGAKHVSVCMKVAARRFSCMSCDVLVDACACAYTYDVVLECNMQMTDDV